jgi:hypothetical protein
MLSKIWQRAALHKRCQCQPGKGVKATAAGEGQNVPSTTLLYLGYVELKEVIEPCYKLLSSEDALSDMVIMFC